MTTFMIEQEIAAQDVLLSDDELTVRLEDGRTLAVPLAWFPRLVHGTAEERANWRFIGRGTGIHWPDLDEDIEVAYLLVGKPSQESQRSFQRWLHGRQDTPEPPVTNPLPQPKRER